MSRFAHVEIEEGPRLRCYCPPELAIHVGDQCIVEADKILEVGRVSELDESDVGSGGGKSGAMVLRCATLQDQAKAKENALRSRMAVDSCQAKVEKYGLEMRLARVRYSFDRKVLMVLFTAESRVDFREMVKDLAAELHTRVEMKQIGVRDEAGHIGGIGPCGRVMCCCSWLHRFESINVKMAKMQGLSLNPSTISGMCSRLKCCLRYEYDQYRDLGRRLPREGTVVDCAEGRGRVMARDVLGQKVRICLENDRVVEVGMENLKESPRAGDADERRRHEDTDP